MNIMLAPMEGVIDHHMRAILTGIGGYQRCVTEFIRVVDQLLPPHVFHRLCPELLTGGKTAAGVPVVVQLLGGIPDVTAANARRVAELGAPGVDINFGCPSKLVNRKAGGAVLLKEPRRVYDITHAVRQAVPNNIPVSGKIRLGYDDTMQALDNARAVADAGASFIVVHARTRADGYKAPARWECLAHINEALNIPVIANGDINSLQDYQRCLEITGCHDVMVGRGAVARPDLARQIQQNATPLLWCEICKLLGDMYIAMKTQPGSKEKGILGRIKQWLVLLKKTYPEARAGFECVRKFRRLEALEAWLKASEKSQ